MFRFVRSNHMMWIGIGLGLLFWILESAIHSFIFLEADFVRELYPLDLNEFWMRVVVVGLLFAFGIYSQSVVNQRKRAENVLAEARHELERRVEERTAELVQANESLKREVEERRRAEDALRGNEAILRHVVDLVPHAIHATDRDGVNLLANRKAAELVGTTVEELTGARLADVMHAEVERSRILEDTRQVIDSGRAKFISEEPFTDAAGTLQFLQTAQIPFNWPGSGKRVALGVSTVITERKRAEKALWASHRFLEIANRHSEMTPLLREFVAEVKSLTGCEAVGMRVLDKDGNVPYLAFEGFSREFYELESPLALGVHQGMCMNVISGSVDPNQSFYSTGGSFYMNGTTRFLATVSEEDKGKTRNVCNRFGYESVALVPIRSGDDILGLIHVADSRENALPREVVTTLEWAAKQLGTAIHRVEAREELARTYDELELRVEKRTEELVKANAKLKRSQEELRRLSSQLLTTQERERGRIARELHDGVGQSLGTLKMRVETLLQLARSDDGRIDLEGLSNLVPMIQKTMDEVRNTSMDLRPSTLDTLGIMATIGWFCREFQTTYPAIRVEREINIEESQVPDRLKTVLYRILQEAFNNIAKHSGADKAKIRLTGTDDEITLAIEDGGRGLDMSTAEGPRKGFGLTSMRERAELSGGCLRIDSKKGSGTLIHAAWPIRGQ